MCRLTWSDLLIESSDPDVCAEWLAPWSGVLGGGLVSPVFLNRFGWWWFRRPEGHIEMLDVFTGRVERAAESHEAFVAEVNEPWWQEGYLLSELVRQFHDAGKVAGAGQCYALAPHPALGGPNPAEDETIDPRFVMVVDVRVWQVICAQALGLA